MSSRAFTELLDGKGAHASPLGCLVDLPMEAAARRIEGFPHSIFDLVLHLNYWMDYDLRRIRGERPPYPEHAAESWSGGRPRPPGSSVPTQSPLAQGPPVDELKWKQTIAEFKSLLEQVEQMAQSDSATLAREIEPTHPSHTERSSALGDILWQTLVHNSYHVGQIAMLRRILGLWPPRAGGDTW